LLTRPVCIRWLKSGWGIRKNREPEWYELFQLTASNGKTRRATLYDLAASNKDDKVYSGDYDHWSAAAHGFMPSLGTLTKQKAPSGTVTGQARLEEMWVLAGQALGRGYLAYQVLSRTFLTAHEPAFEQVVN